MAVQLASLCVVLHIKRFTIVLELLTAGRSGFDNWQEQGFFSFCDTASRPALGRTQPPIQWVPGALSMEVKRLGREVTSIKCRSQRMRGAILSLSHCVFMAWCLVGLRNGFTFTCFPRPDRLWGSPLSNACRGFLAMGGAVPPLPHVSSCHGAWLGTEYVFMAWHLS
jgi:hypothetical protein